ncbi:HEAT repeat domain-containing protein [bacterium]|nr:HEAT repeat domain-containing protein [bacterium]
MTDFEEIQKLINDEDYNVVLKGVESLEKLAGNEKAIEKLKELSDHKHPEIRKASIKSLGHIGKPEFIQTLTKAFEDDHYDVRRVAVHALAMVQGGETEVINALRIGFKNSDLEVRKFCLRALGRYNNPEIVDYIGEEMEADSHFTVKKVALEILEKYKNEKSFKLITKAFFDGDEFVRARAAEALAALNDKNAIQFLRQGLQDSSSEVRRRSAESLLQLDKNVAIDSLASLLEKGNPIQVNDALDALIKSKHERVKLIFQQYLNKVEGDAKLRIIGGIGDFKISESLDDLLALLEKSNEPQILNKVVEALGHLGDKNAIKPLKKAAKNSKIDANKIAIALKQLGADEKGKGCFIATAVYGNEFCYEVEILRNFRDTRLLHNFFGKAFVNFYYLVSPKIADFLENQNTLKNFIRKNILNPIVKKVKK